MNYISLGRITNYFKPTHLCQMYSQRIQRNKIPLEFADCVSEKIQRIKIHDWCLKSESAPLCKHLVLTTLKDGKEGVGLYSGMEINSLFNSVVKGKIASLPYRDEHFLGQDSRGNIREPGINAREVIIDLCVDALLGEFKEKLKEEANKKSTKQ